MGGVGCRLIERRVAHGNQCVHRCCGGSFVGRIVDHQSNLVAERHDHRAVVRPKAGDELPCRGFRLIKRRAFHAAAYVNHQRHVDPDRAIRRLGCALYGHRLAGNGRLELLGGQSRDRPGAPVGDGGDDLDGRVALIVIGHDVEPLGGVLGERRAGQQRRCGERGKHEQPADQHDHPVKVSSERPAVWRGFKKNPPNRNACNGELAPAVPVGGRPQAS